MWCESHIPFQNKDNNQQTHMKKITINGKEYGIKYTIRALFIFEQITGKTFKIESLLDNYIFLYSMILANNKNEALEWDEFLDAVDNDVNIFNSFSEVLQEQEKKEKVFGTEEEDNKKKD